MPGKNEHQIRSAQIAFIFELGRQIYLYKNGVKIDPLESIGSLLLAPIAGAIGGVLPDKLEPATNPNHRAFCHSIAGGAAVCTGISKIPLNTDNRNFNFLNVCLRSSGIGYVTHLAQDADTPKSISLI